MKNVPFRDFQEASRAALAFLQQRLGFRLWMVTRTSGDDWTILQARDGGYGVAEGTTLRWTDSFCSRMVEGRGPRVAPDSRAVPAYAQAPIARQFPISAYVGVPLHGPDGGLFGTLCAIDPAPQPATLVDEQPLLELMASLLSTILQLELAANDAARHIERLKEEAETDPLTGLYNRRGWDRLVNREEERCRRYGHPAFVLQLDLDGLKVANDEGGHEAGDALIRRTARALQSAVRDVDIVGRLGGDEFGIVAVECDASGVESLKARVRARLAEQGVNASIGAAPRKASQGLHAAAKEADRAMYEAKSRSRRREGPERRSPGASA